MNYLAHSYLSGEDEQLLVGNFIGDFVKGDPQKLELPPQITDGIRLHRKIDAFCESHSSLKYAKAFLPEKQKRYASVILDILNDHFLAKSWTNYHNLPLKTFSTATYQAIDKYLAILPPDFQFIYNYIKADDWLSGYSSKEMSIYAINRMLSRFKDPEAPKQTLDILLGYYSELEKSFHELIMDINNNLILK
jgi:acyl carrier protein phosphodiesterase